MAKFKIQIAKKLDTSTETAAVVSLRQKGDRSFGAEALRLMEGRIYFSMIELSQKLVRLKQTLRSTLRAAVPDRVAGTHAAG
jgi:hypothetical protein